MAARELAERADRIATAAETEANALLAGGRLREAKVVLTNAQRDLRDLKRDIADEQRSIREAASDRRSKISKSGQTVGLFMGSKARGTIARSRAAAKRDLAQRQADALRPFDALKSAVDRMIANIDRAKAQVAEAVPANKNSEQPAATQQGPREPTARPPITATTPTGNPAVPPRWAKDPTGRHELRWWNGAEWTEHVSDAGVVASDPLIT